MHVPSVSSLALLLLAASQVNAHGAIVGATGDQGGSGSALGIDPNTPRDGTRRNPFQQDSTRFSEQRGDAADTCGSTLAGGDNDGEAGTQKIMQLSGDTLPQVSQGGMVMMTLHQVNSDGAGPYTCEVDSTGQGTNWTPITVTQNVEGNRNSRNRAGSETDHPLTAQLDADTTCTGTVAGQSNVCMVRCMNGANAGPFGGCVPIQMVGAGNSTAAAAPATSASATGAGAATDEEDDATANQNNRQRNRQNINDRDTEDDGMDDEEDDQEDDD